MKTEILIVGSGCAGLYSALNLPSDKQITIITKDIVEHSDSYLAQGGICMLQNEEDFESFFEDTLHAGHYENNRESVEIMIRSSQDVLKDLLSYGVDFQRTEDGELCYTREGAHSKNRILYHEDITGQEITSKLYEQVKKRKNITLLEHCSMLDLMEDEKGCSGVVAKMPDHSLECITAEVTLLACGGIGGLYEHSTNFKHLTADGVAIAMEHGVELSNINYVQIHPTTLYTQDKKERSFLISESVRGEGAILLNKNKERFVDELLPRDVLTKKILEQMEKDQTEFVWLSAEKIPTEELDSHFPNIVAHCREHGYDIHKECIPVVPAQHYFMGGIKVNSNSKTSMNDLYAIGETACNGVHGRNRLASNSLLESLVFAKRAALDIAHDDTEGRLHQREEVRKELSKYKNEEKLKEHYKKIVLDEIERLNKNDV